MTAPARVVARLSERMLPRRPFETASWLGGPALTLTFDDGRSSDIDRMLPILDNAGVKGVFAPTTGLLGQPGYFTTGDVRALVGQGHEIASHLDEHVPLIDRPRSEIAAGLRRSKAALEEIAGRSIGSVVYPFGANDRYVRATAAAEYRLGFSAWPGTSRGAFNRFAIRRIAFGSFTRRGEDSDDYVQSVVRAAVAKRQWLVLMIHSDAAARSADHDAQLTRLLAFAAERGLPVCTASGAEEHIAPRLS